MEKEIKKRICFVVPRAWYLFDPQTENCKDEVGGTQKQAFLLSTALARENKYEVHFVVADSGQDKICIINNVYVWKSFRFSDNFVKKSLVFLDVLKKINADLYIFRAADFGVALSVFFIKFFLRKKTMYMLASQKEIQFKTHRKENGILTASSMYFVYKHADCIVAQTHDQYEGFKKNINRTPNAIVRNVIEQDSYYIDNKTQKKIILWVGRLDPIKNPGLFVDLARIFTDSEFVMIAPIAKEHKKYGQEFLTQTHFPGNLKLLPFVHPSEINEYYKNAAIYVITSESEGFSNTMMEAMAARCAILSLNVNPDCIFDGNFNGLFANGNMETFQRYFEKLINDAEFAINLGINAHDYIRRNHNLEHIVNQFTELALSQKE